MTAQPSARAISPSPTRTRETNLAKVKIVDTGRHGPQTTTARTGERVCCASDGVATSRRGRWCPVAELGKLKYVPQPDGHRAQTSIRLLHLQGFGPGRERVPHLHRDAGSAARHRAHPLAQTPSTESIDPHVRGPGDRHRHPHRPGQDRPNTVIPQIRVARQLRRATWT